MLESSLGVTVDGAVTFHFTVRNAADEPVELTFRDAGRADFAVLEDGEEVWRWSDGRMFAQVLRTVELEPDEETTIEESWPDPRPGEYTAAATLRVREADVSAETSFSV